MNIRDPEREIFEDKVEAGTEGPIGMKHAFNEGVLAFRHGDLRPNPYHAYSRYRAEWFRGHAYARGEAAADMHVTFVVEVSTGGGDYWFPVNDQPDLATFRDAVQWLEGRAKTRNHYRVVKVTRQIIWDTAK